MSLILLMCYYLQESCETSMEAGLKSRLGQRGQLAVVFQLCGPKWVKI